MLYQISDGTVSAGGKTVLSHIDFEIRGNEKIAVVGKNGAGKTTLLRLIAGELSLDRDDGRMGPGIRRARQMTVGMLSQQAFQDGARTVEEEMLGACPCEDWFDRERFAYEKEYDAAFTGFGFAKADKGKRLSEFSGGEQTKIALIRLLLQKPDILLLDEPTNHLDTEAVEWMEGYMRRYKKAVVMVSHDRFFLDQLADVIYELEDGKLTRYPGNYTHYREEKQKRAILQKKAYERQQEEMERLGGLVERFKHKPNKAAFARAKKKAMERMERLEKPRDENAHIFTGEIGPLVPGGKWALSCERLKIGYGRALLEVTLRLRRGQKIALLGPNGVGKTTFLKTVAGLIEPLDGECALGNRTTIGYFDQMSASIQSELSVIGHFTSLFPGLTDREARGVLGAYLFGGREAAKPVRFLSGGEKARLVLAEILQSRPNFLILDEPTNHMDIQARETLESAFKAYAGTILFVSHDRYFIRQIADAVLIFEGQSVLYYPFGYDHYVERKRRQKEGEPIAAQMRAEEQALVAGIRAVPKAERRRVRELSPDEAYADWRLRLAAERMEDARARFVRLAERMEQMTEAWHADERFWMGKPWGREEECRLLAAQRGQAWEEWDLGCREWLDAAEAAPQWEG